MIRSALRHALVLAGAALALLAPVSAFGAASGIRDVKISIDLGQNGTAAVTEIWTVSAYEGTEWYLVRENLGDMVISGLSVRDETGRKFITEEEWDSDRPRAEKAGRCGLLHKHKGVEICWGIGDYGDHTWIVRYTMSNAVKSLRDADMLHLQVLSPGLSSKPEHVSVRITAPGLSSDKVRFWGFGFEGTSKFEPEDGGAVFMESGGRIKSAIVLLRFEKGLFGSSSVQDRGFEDVLAGALDGAHFEDEGDDDGAFLGMVLSMILTLSGFFIIIGAALTSKRRILGCKASEVEWNRETPYGGDLRKSNYTLSRLGEVKKGNTYASALILRMIYDGAIRVIHRDEGKVDLAFDDAHAQSLSPDSKELYDMLKEASGNDEILQDKEFSRWSRKHYKRVGKWVESAGKTGKGALQAEGQMKGESYTEAGQAEARKLLGFKKFLSDFTLISERGSREVALWRDYLVFGALFGIADKVAKELHDIDPKLLEEATMQDYNTTTWLLWHGNSMASSITNAQIRAAQAMGRTSGSFGGFGGGTSFGGGGGFSGGGFGGGAR